MVGMGGEGGRKGEGLVGVCEEEGGEGVGGGGGVRAGGRVGVWVQCMWCWKG